MDFKKILSAPLHAGQAVVRDLMDNPDQSDAKRQVMDLLAEQSASQAKQFTPEQPKAAFTLPNLDDSLTDAAKAAKAEAEAKGEQFVPNEDDFNDAGPYGYMHKKAIHDALLEYEKELQANAPHIDYEGIMKSRLADLANAPPEHRTNPLFQFAMAMGNPEHAQELVATHNKAESEANTKQGQRWKELLDMKQQALEGSIKQAMAEGDQRKIIAGKWLEQLAQIEHDKAALTGKQTIQDTKDEAAERRTILRGQWASTVAAQRANAMLSAVGLKQGSTTYRTLMDNSRALMQSLLKRGTDFGEAQNTVEDWLDDQIKNLPAQSSAPTAPVEGAAAAPAAAVNPLEAAVKAARGGKP